ncbi:class I SAM-dependent methyltransferase [Elusimicrobiota bacterium]
MKNIWFESEGDNWFERNKESLGKKTDICQLLLDIYSIKPEKVLEIGAANGYRLASIHENLGSKVTAVEPSKEAVEYGKSKFPFIEFIRSTCEDMELEGKFDCVILNFVFHWIYRENLYTCIEKIDRAIQEFGYLIIGDFGIDYYIKRKYHHLDSTDFYTWKMAYWELFTKSGNYLELAKLRFDHDSHKISPEIDNSNMGTVVLLKKQDINIEV